MNRSRSRAMKGRIAAGDRLVEIRTVLAADRARAPLPRRADRDLPRLVDLPERLHALPELEAALARMLDDAGLLRDDASPRLGELRRRSAISARISRNALTVWSRPAESAGIADRYVTIRKQPLRGAGEGLDGERGCRAWCRTVRSRGDAFIEPMFAIDLNNRLLLVREEEEGEERRLAHAADRAGGDRP